MAQAWLLAFAGVVLGQLAPGPNLLAVAGAALGDGRRAGLFVALGVACGVFVWVAFVVFALAGLLSVFPAALSAMKLAGGAYLAFVAAKSLHTAFRGVEQAPTPASGRAASPARAFLRGLAVNLSNPKSALMWSAVATFLHGAGLGAPDVLSLAPAGALSAAVIYGAYALLLSTGAARRGYARFARLAQGLFGLAFGVIGGRLIFEGAREAAR